MSDEGASREKIAKRINFERLYSNWHAAMAAYNNPDGPDDDEQMMTSIRTRWRRNATPRKGRS